MVSVLRLHKHQKNLDRNIAEIVCTKNRNGGTGTVKLLADLPGCKFKNLAF